MTKRICDIATCDRPREKIEAKGVAALSDYELLQVLIGSGTRGVHVGKIAHALLKAIKARGMDALEYKDILSIPGMSTAKTSAVLSAFEFVRRRQQSAGRRIERVQDVLPLVAHIRDKKQEHLLAITLDGAKTVLNIRTITIGTLTASLIHPREIFADAIADRAASIILVHNHPSGLTDPSAEDLLATENMVKAGELLGITVRDHIIVTKDSYCSMSVRGLL